MATSALLNWLSNLWSYYWFRPAPLVNLAFCRIIMAAAQGVFLVWWDYLWLLHERAARPDSLYNPLIALRLLLLPMGVYRPSVAVIDAVYRVTIAASVTAAVGLCSRLSLALLALGSMFIHAYIYSLGELHHPEALMMIALTLLAFGPSGRALSIDTLIAGFRATDDAAALRGAQGYSAMARWPVLAMRWVVALVYLSAAIHKLSLAGLDWMNGYTLQYLLLYHGLERGNDFAVWLSRHHELVWFMSWSTILFEGTFFLVLVWPTLAWLYLPMGIGLHVGIATTSIADPFLIYLPVYAAFVPWHTMWRGTRTSIAGGQLHSQRGRHQEAAGRDEQRELERGSLYNEGTVRHRLAERISFWIASVMILSVLLLQASATYRPLCMGTVSLLSLPHKFRYVCPPGLWPFIDYPMYAEASHEGDHVDQVIVIGVLPDFREVRLSSGELGLGAWIYADTIDLERILDKVDSYNAKHRMGLAGLRVESQPVIVTRDGIRLGSSRVLLEAKIGTPR